VARARWYLGSAALAALGVAAAWALGVALGGPQPSLLAVAIAALGGGVGPGLACWALSLAGCAYFLTDPRLAWAVPSAHDRADLLEFAVEAGFVAVALGGARVLHRRERAERRRATRTAERLRRLQAVTAALSAARTPREAAQAVLDEAAPFGASAAAVAWRADAGALELIAWRGSGDEAVGRAVRSDAPAELPVARAYRDGRALFLETPAEIAAFGGVAHAPGFMAAAQACAALPLVVDGRPAGALAFAFADARVFDPEDRTLFQALADSCAQALERAFLFEVEQGLRSAAERATRQRDEVLEAVAHDLRSPLNAVQLYADALAARAGPRDGEALRAIGVAASRMERLVEDLLDDAALDAGRLALDRAPCDAAALAADALEAVRPAAERAGVRLELQATAPPPLADCDRGRAVQVLENLLANAVHASPRGGAVTLSVEARAGAVRFEVRDGGPGIAAADLPHVFDRRRRTRGARGKGSGLGLAIARALAELHGGRIEASSGSAGGAVFAVELPLAAPPVRVAVMR
jgi:signal transduction histidine kinase